MSGSSSQTKKNLREIIGKAYLADEASSVAQLIEVIQLDLPARLRIEKTAVALVDEIRHAKQSGLMETFLAEYGLSTKEGVALMCLAEALLRVPDSLTIDALIQDKIVPADWGQHIGHSGSPLVNASTWALMLTGKVISAENADHWDVPGTMHSMIKRIGDPLIRNAVKQAMRVLGHQFVLGEDIDKALHRAAENESKGYTYSYDMLGEAAHTAQDARKYFLAYSSAISALSKHCNHDDIRLNPSFSVKLSALHPRYEFTQQHRAVNELTSRITSLAVLAKNANMSFNIDAEEADRLDLSLDIFEQVLSNPDLKGWDGFGMVVQSYMPRALSVIDWLHHLADSLDRRIMVRLVKGAYWDSEIKKAQVNGLSAYPVFTRKVSTDICFMACARRLFDYSDRLYPQFATHNAHTVAAVLEIAGDHTDFEFQRLHGMGESLYEILREQHKQSCRIYAPVGIHKDLLAYLVRRLLENGTNSSFVNQLLDESVASTELVRDPLAIIEELDVISNPRISLPADIFAPDRINSKGWNLADPIVLKKLQKQRSQFKQNKWLAAPLIAGIAQQGEEVALINPADFSDEVGRVVNASAQHIEKAMQLAEQAQPSWSETPHQQRASCLIQLADLYEENTAELMMLMAREAGKNLADSLSEVREAVDFCRYYASQAETVFADNNRQGRGIFVCISPWNFPLAIFTGQIVAALVSGNAVIAKPAEQAPLTAARAIELMYQSGIPVDVLHLLPGDGAEVGGRLTADPRVDGICFTGSTETAQLIHNSMAQKGNPQAPLIAETGGLNTMIVDSSALPEQAVTDIVSSAFQSAGQRCSALRVLYLQSDIADVILNLLKGAMDELFIGDPWSVQTDIGPVIDTDARVQIEKHCKKLQQQGRLIHKVAIAQDVKDKGYFVEPAVFEISSIDQLEREIFGPVLHVITFEAEQLDELMDSINASGYGLTMGVHTRVDNRVQGISDEAHVGNIYINRNQIGAVVGAQPFGGEGLSGTGPKAGGPFYLYRFTRSIPDSSDRQVDRQILTELPGIFSDTGIEGFQQLVSHSLSAYTEWKNKTDRHSLIQQAIKKCPESVVLSINKTLDTLPDLVQETIDLPGPTGESNRLSVHGRGVFLCLGGSHDNEQVLTQLMLVLLAGNAALVVASENNRKAIDGLINTLIELGVPAGLLTAIDKISLKDIQNVEGLAGVFYENADDRSLSVYRDIRKSLAVRKGAILPLIDKLQDWSPLIAERSMCIDTTASGGNAALLASAS